MFEAVELGQKLSKDNYKQVVPQLRVDLVNAQYELRQANFPVIILILGDDRHACNAVLNSLMEWMDARYIEAFYFGRPSQEEQQRPRFWRYWYVLPPQGKIGVFMGAWAASALAERVREEIDNAEFEQRCQHICRFEQALADDGALILKFWLHLPKAIHEQRRKKTSRNGWTDDRTWAVYESYDDAIRVGEQLVRLTSTAMAPWILVDSSNSRYRIVTVAQAILSALAARSQNGPAQERPVALPATVTLPNYQQTVLSTVDLSASIAWEDYRPQLD
ncbi:MAG: polyphosphate:AMP phosphotransferase, partial [Cyanobacteria bacterium Co-bin8]|nr:polyphosphate:AMP phosphotransferase [Cyanobacteria bacterium Co-bin8]